MTDKILPIVKCPKCGKPVPWVASQTHRPFCSDRCKMIDFGSWASESNVIPGDPADIEAPPEFD